MARFCSDSVAAATWRVPGGRALRVGRQAWRIVGEGAQRLVPSPADTALQAERQALKQRETELSEQTQALTQREAVMQARLQAQEQALGEARAQNSTLQQRLEQAELEAQGQHKHLLGLQEDLRLLRERRHADEDRNQAELKALNEDRRRTEERADSAAARAALEIDRARQEAKAERTTRQRLEKLLEEQREAHHAALAQSERWVASWGTAQLTPSPDQALPADAWRDGSIRQLVRASAPGRQVRVRLSNAHGPTPLQINAASVGLVAAIGVGYAMLR